jgi:LacI family transcriptional regulator
MNDVAREAKVGLKTVSRYVNGETNIGAPLAARIQDAIDALGYRRNLAAASIRPGWTSRMLGLIISDLANPYYSMIAGAVESTARDHGYLLTIGSSDESGRHHDLLVDRLMGQRVDSLIVVPPRESARDWAQLPPPIPPLVFVDRPSAFDRADTVLADNVGGAHAATAALAERGARRIAFVGDSLDIWTMRERLAGYHSALLEHHLDEHPTLIVTDAHRSGDAAVAIGRLLTDGSIDAVFAANNRACVGALIAFGKHGARLPLIGFDDFEAATLSSPAISVVTHDIALMGTTAARIAFSRVSGATDEHRTHVLPTTLILRGSERV